MPTKKYKQKLLKHRICVVARAVACVAFLVLTIIGVSSLVRAMSLDTVEHQNGIPSAWKVASLGQPETITVPITYWDQRQDDCSDPDRQFEWSACTLYAKGIIPDVVKSQLGSDGLPVPTYTNSTDAWAAYHDVFTANVTGNDPVLPTDNFYRWFHEAYDEDGKQLSQQIEREVTFTKVPGTTNSYTYGSHGTFPLDDVTFSDDDDATSTGHNFHFTAHLQIPMKIAADGTEEFRFLGDDDVWVFLNGQLVLDLGGLHSETGGSFTIDQNGNVQSTVQDVNVDQTCRQSIANPLKVGNSIYNSQLERCSRQAKTTTIYTNFQPGDVVNLDFFYAERSTSESNTTITITNMNWPISADSNVDGEIIGKVQDTNNNLIEYTTSIKNRDPQFPLQLDRISTYIKDTATVTNADDTTEEYNNAGFLPHSVKTLSYTTTPDDEDSWQPVDISAPASSETGFKLATPLEMAPAGQTGDTLYFRFLAETSEYVGTITNRTSYYTLLNGAAGVTYDDITLNYIGTKPAVKYNVTVNYEIDWEDNEPDDNIRAPETHTEKVEDGQSYAITSPGLEGFTPDQSIVSGTVDGDDVTVTVRYRKQTEPQPTYSVRIRFLRSDTNAQILPEYNSEHTEGDTFTYYPKDVENYTKDADQLDITVDGDIDLIVYYTPIPSTPSEGPIVPPFTPIDPTEPDEPADSDEELPVLAVAPSDDDDDLVFLAPLGEVAFVPNTGVISEYIAPIFEQYFAGIILSQGFILAALLIFSGSFATYFSLRKYLDLSVAPRTAATTKKMPRNIANSKTARNMQKSAQKSSKTQAATKVTRKSSSKRK